MTPIANLTDNIDFDALEEFFRSIGLDQYVNVTALTRVVEFGIEELEDTIKENPEAFLKDYFDFNLTETVTNFVSE